MPKMPHAQQNQNQYLRVQFQMQLKKYYLLAMHTNAMNLNNSPQIALQVHHKIVFFLIKISVGNIVSKDDVDHWLQQFSVSSNMKYNAQIGYKRKGVKVVYARWYICQCKHRKLTKKEEGEKEAAKKRRENRKEALKL